MKQIILSENNIKIMFDNLLNEITSNEVDLTSFEQQDKLNTKIWDNDIIKSKVRIRLLEIVDEFIDTVNINNIDYKDIILTGSLANYNWSKYSDIDLHIVMDFKKINKDVELVRQFFINHKTLWNNDHTKLKIYGFPVEIYVEDINDETESSGVYSLEKNKWIHKPTKNNVKFNKNKVKNKSANLINQIDNLYSRFKKTKNTFEDEKLSKEVKETWDKIKSMRKQGLKKGGEQSVENIVYKVLRRTDKLDKLYELKIMLFDKIKTIK